MRNVLRARRPLCYGECPRCRRRWHSYRPTQRKIDVWTPTEEEWRAARAAALNRLGCTWDELVAMHLSGHYETPEHFKTFLTFDDAFRGAL